MPEGPLQGVVVERDRECRMRDGTILRADVYRPRTAATLPVLLCRTCYDKAHDRYVRLATALAERGYLAVVQDIRGRYRSDGDWVWHMSVDGASQEQSDGYDSCEWAARLDGADGQVGSFGNSYPSWLIWQMAAARPPSLKAIFTSGFAPSTHHCTSGIFETGIRLRWQHQMAVSSRIRAGDRTYPQTVEEAMHNWDRLLRGKYLWQVPLDAMPDHLFGPDAAMQKRYWREIAVDFWQLDRLHPQVEVPVCTLTGWWDRLSDAALHFTGMVANGPAATRDRHRLIIGPWVHDVEADSPPDLPRDYGPEAAPRLPELIARWYDHHLKGRDTGIADEPPVRLFVLNENRWRLADAWPPADSTETAFFLDGAGAANTPAGDGRLVPAPPADTAVDRYRYDPADPVPSLVGPSGQAEACEQAPLRDRRDILVYQTAPLERDLLLIGPVACRLWVACDCPDTDFVARLIEVGADGRAINISQGILRARYREGYDREVTLPADEPVEIRVRMLAVGIRFRAGSRLRLDITSSDFPAFDRNHNTGRPFQSDPELRPAAVSVLHGGAYPSAVLLPVAPT